MYFVSYGRHSTSFLSVRLTVCAYFCRFVFYLVCQRFLSYCLFVFVLSVIHNSCPFGASLNASIKLSFPSFRRDKVRRRMPKCMSKYLQNSAIQTEQRSVIIFIIHSLFIDNFMSKKSCPFSLSDSLQYNRVSKNSRPF